MDRDTAIRYVAEHGDDDAMDRAELTDVFVALAGREPTEQENEALWSHCCEMA
jgi:hypothetical protein